MPWPCSEIASLAVRAYLKAYDADQAGRNDAAQREDKDAVDARKLVHGLVAAARSRLYAARVLPIARFRAARPHAARDVVVHGVLAADR